MLDWQVLEHCSFGVGLEMVSLIFVGTADISGSKFRYFRGEIQYNAVTKFLPVFAKSRQVCVTLKTWSLESKRGFESFRDYTILGKSFNS